MAGCQCRDRAGGAEASSDAGLFRERLQAALADTWVVGPPGAAVGFYIVKGDELYQLYVSAPARGSGVAAMLIADAERACGQAA